MTTQFTPEPTQAPGQHEAGGTRFVAHIELFELNARLPGQSPQGAFGAEIAAAALPVVNRRTSGAGPSVSDGD